MAIAASHVMEVGTSPGPAPAGRVRIYPRPDGTLMKVDEAGNEIPVGGTEDADMEKAVYDPTAVEADAFDRGNHHGSQEASTITQDLNHRFVSDAEKSGWNSKEPGFAKSSAFNKSFGTGAGQVAEGNHTHAGLPVVVDIDGIDTMVLLDTNRAKTMSVETCTFHFANNSVGDDEWMHIGFAVHEDTGHTMLHNGTIIGVSAHTTDGKSANQFFRLYINDTEEVSNFFQFSAGAGEKEYVATDKDVNFNIEDKLRIRAGNNGSVEDITVTLLIKWRP